MTQRDLSTATMPLAAKQLTSNLLKNILHRLGSPVQLAQRPLTSTEVALLIFTTKKKLIKRKRALIRINGSFVVCGDTHGQYRDVLRLFHLNKWPPETRYLFLGDYVDRGSHGIEVICLMMALQLAFPEHVFLLRGNHESREINQYYGFREETMSRYSEEMYEWFNEMFEWMPLAALINDAILCMHGGIPRNVVSLRQIEEVQLPIDSPRDNLIAADLLWSDPSEDVKGFVPSPRGLGCQFGMDALDSFLKNTGVELICRAHQVFFAGYKFFGSQLISIFSAPNYGNEFKNQAAFLVVRYNEACKIVTMNPFFTKEDLDNSMAIAADATRA